MIILLDLMGGVALLLWGLHMVNTGVIRAFGADFRRILGSALRSRWRAFAAGVGITAVLQSSTATALLTSSLAARGMVELVPALAIMLGANVGTSLVVQLLSLNISALAPVLLVAGVIAFRQGKKTIVRDLGRVAVGLGLMLVSLHILLDTLAPAENAPGVRTIMGLVTNQPLLNVLIGAFFAWAAHSSVAAVSLVMSLAFSSFVTPAAALALVLGANVGSAINPLVEGTQADNPASRRSPLGNLAIRFVGCAVLFPFLQPLAEHLVLIDPNPARMTADFHTAFNVVLAAVFILPLDTVARVLTRLLPEKPPSANPGTPAFLDEAALETPTIALSSAVRETLHMCEIVETMLQRGMKALMSSDRQIVSEVSELDNALDELHEAIKLYVIRVTRDSLDDDQGQRAMEIISFSINLEHIGDIIDKNLMELATKKIKRKLQFSSEGAGELEGLYQRVIESFNMAVSIFLSGNVELARQLLAAKTELRQAEIAANESHLARLREGRPESIETSSLHLDVLRDLKRIHSHICATAYPVLEAVGELRDSRLKVAADDAQGDFSHDGRT